MSKLCKYFFFLKLEIAVRKDFLFLASIVQKYLKILIMLNENYFYFHFPYNGSFQEQNKWNEKGIFG